MKLPFLESSKLDYKYILFNSIICCIVGLFLQKLCKSVYKRLRLVYYGSKFNAPPHRFLIGNTHQLGGADKYFKFLIDTSKIYDKYFMLWYGSTQPAFICYDPDVIKKVILAEPPKISNLYRFLSDWIGHGLLTSNGNHWARNRRLLTPAFHFDILKTYINIYNETADTLIEKWSASAERHEPLDLYYDASLCTLDVVLPCAFSMHLNCQTSGKNHPYINSVQTLGELIVKRGYNLLHHNPWIYFNFTSAGKQFQQQVNVSHEFTEGIIRKRQAELENVGNDEVKSRKSLDFLDTLLNARYEDGTKLSLIDIRNEVDTFLFAGHDTTAGTLSVTLYCLAKYPEHQSKIRDEVSNILQNKSQIEWDDLSQLKYTSLCIKEALRLFPPVPFNARTANKDLQIDGKIVPEGSIIIYSGFIVHRDPNVWDHPDEFDPSRFLPENIGDRHPFAYIPFSAGARNCIGQNFATNFLKIAIAKLVHRFDFITDFKKEISYSAPLTLKLHNVEIYLRDRL
ncbi:Cytochrome P450 4A10 [Trichoplax sp. H2]|nr:Cytochrome P450 4A10 [Trichoplax sp. H2]|eukprot:RDD41060.1 Cytochrome P450 4A10 [Trichoplax sp. H2]